MIVTVFCKTRLRVITRHLNQYISLIHSNRKMKAHYYQKMKTLKTQMKMMTMQKAANMMMKWTQQIELIKTLFYNLDN